MEWDRLDSIEDSYNNLERNLNSHYSYVEDTECIQRINRLFNKAKKSFINAARDHILDEEMTRADNWCEYTSKFMKNLAAFTDGELAGYENRKMTKDSLENKLMNINLPDSDGLNSIKAIKKALEENTNIVRYTLLFEPEEYTQKFLEVQRLLKAKRVLETVKVRNTWTNNSGYKGIDTVVKCIKDDKEYLFEIKFHTLKSFNAETESKKYYEIARDNANYSIEERRKADDKQYEIYESLDVPPGVFDIKSYGL